MNGKNTFKGLLIMIPACAPRVSVYYYMVPILPIIIIGITEYSIRNT